VLVALVASAIVAVSAPAAQAAFGVEKFFAGNCKAAFEKCGEGAKEGSQPKRNSKATGRPEAIRTSELRTSS
jgi:hypothetical protein